MRVVSGETGVGEIILQGGQGARGVVRGGTKAWGGGVNGVRNGKGFPAETRKGVASAHMGGNIARLSYKFLP